MMKLLSILTALCASVALGQPISNATEEVNQTVATVTVGEYVLTEEVNQTFAHPVTVVHCDGLPEFYVDKKSTLQRKDKPGCENAIYDSPSRLRLNLSNKTIKKLSKDVFRGLSNVRILGLNQNNLTKIPDKIFSDMSNLEVLHLTDNALGKLSKKTFNGLDSLRFLRLRNNNLHNLSKKTFSNLSLLENVHFDNETCDLLDESHFQFPSGLEEIRREDLCIFK